MLSSKVLVQFLYAKVKIRLKAQNHFVTGDYITSRYSHLCSVALVTQDQLTEVQWDVFNTSLFWVHMLRKTKYQNLLLTWLKWLIAILSSWGYLFWNGILDAVLKKGIKWSMMVSCLVIRNLYGLHQQSLVAWLFLFKYMYKMFEIQWVCHLDTLILTT